jgi:hypothetical protein
VLEAIDGNGFQVRTARGKCYWGMTVMSMAGITDIASARATSPVADADAA